jgi:hypothetical protein
MRKRGVNYPSKLPRNTRITRKEALGCFFVRFLYFVVPSPSRPLSERETMNGHAPSLDISWCNHAFAYAQYRSAVVVEMPSAWAACSLVRPAK